MAKKTHRQKRISRLRVESARLQTAPCPQPGKIPYPSEGQALEASFSMRQHGKNARVYKCDCGVYHITTKAYNPRYNQGRNNTGYTNPKNTQKYLQATYKQPSKKKKVYS